MGFVKIMVLRNIMFLNRSKQAHPVPFRLVGPHHLASFPGILCPPFRRQPFPLFRYIKVTDEVFPGFITVVEAMAVAMKAVVVLERKR